jgi:hypothetical protein
MSVTRYFVPLFVISSSWWSVARAEHLDEPAEEPIIARAPGNDDSFTPGLTHASAAGRGIATGVASWNGASHTTSVDINGEVQIYGPLRLVLRVDNALNNVDAKARPGIGGAVQFLSEAKHGVAASAYFVYKAEGFSEAEGELEGLVSFGKQFGAVHGTLNLAYGQDPEGNERDGEAALGLHIEPVRGLFTGVVGRFRDALGSNGDKSTHILQDALGGLSATYVIGKVGITGTAGFAGIKTVGSSMQGGAEAAMSVGAVF